MSGVLPDLLRPGLGLVICGSAASSASARAGAYYAHPRNRFWETLHAVGLTPRRLRPDEFPRLLDFDIGLTDLAKDEAGRDDQLSAAAYDAAALRRRILANRPRVLAFNGKAPASAFLGHARPAHGRQDERLGTTAIFVLPSTSPAAVRWWDPGPWRALAEQVGKPDPS